jgi:alpha-glucosidase
VATFERDIQPEAADYATSVVVKLGSTTIAGSVAESPAGTLTWAPGAALAAGTYDVTVFHVKSDLAGDSVPMQAPYTFSFSVP